MGTYAKERAKQRIEELVTQGLDAVTFWREATEPVARAVPHDADPCW